MVLFSVEVIEYLKLQNFKSQYIQMCSGGQILKKNMLQDEIKSNIKFVLIFLNEVIKYARPQDYLEHSVIKGVQTIFIRLTNLIMNLESSITVLIKSLSIRDCEI